MSRPQTLPVVVALDGPSGSGKSSVAKAVAAQLGARYLDTGAMYRALTWAVQAAGADVTAPGPVMEVARRTRIRPGSSPDQIGIWVDDTDVTAAIRGPQVTAAVSYVARLPEVREFLIQAQREIIDQARAEGMSIVVEGRDITTVVAPDAQVRALITASPEVRMARRAGELGTRAEAVSDQIVKRDAIDSQVNNFTDPAPGVTLIDTTEMPFDAVVAAVLDLVDRSCA